MVVVACRLSLQEGPALPADAAQLLTNGAQLGQTEARGREKVASSSRKGHTSFGDGTKRISLNYFLKTGNEEKAACESSGGGARQLADSPQHVTHVLASLSLPAPV